MRSVRLPLLPLSDRPLDRLDDLDERDDEEGQRERDAVLEEADVLKAERLLEERHIQHHEREHEREGSRAPEVLVVALHREHAVPLGAHVEAVEDLRHAQREKRHRRAV